MLRVLRLLPDSIGRMPCTKRGTGMTTTDVSFALRGMLPLPLRGSFPTSRWGYKMGEISAHWTVRAASPRTSRHYDQLFGRGSGARTILRDNSGALDNLVAKSPPLHLRHCSRYSKSVTTLGDGGGFQSILLVGSQNTLLPPESHCQLPR